MRNSEAFLCGAITSFVIWSCVAITFTTPNWKWHTQAIEHGAAQYNATTGAFEWIDPEKEKP